VSVINIDTSIGSEEAVSIRTRLELDADIITIIHDSILQNKAVAQLISIHYLNVGLANIYFRKRLFSFFQLHRLITRAIPIAVSGIWIVSSVIAFQMQNGNQDFSALALFIIGLVGGPFVILRFLPIIIRLILGYEIRRQLYNAKTIIPLRRS
jgi:hypothetical protein